MTPTEKRRAQTAEATRIRLARARARKIQAAADLLRKEGWSLCSPAMKDAGWKVVDPGPVSVVDGDGDLWSRGRDGKYYLVSRVANLSGWTLDDIRFTCGIQEDPA